MAPSPVLLHINQKRAGLRIGPFFVLYIQNLDTYNRCSAAEAAFIEPAVSMAFLKIRDGSPCNDCSVREEGWQRFGPTLWRWCAVERPETMPINIARIATGNVPLLKDLSLEEVLEIHPLLNAQGFDYGQARKVKPIKARPINTILDKSEGQNSVFEKMLLATLEGTETLKRGSFICWGVNDDVWQQTGKKLHDKYIPTEMDEDGWVTYVPKEGENAVENAYQVANAKHALGPCGGFSVINPWWGDERLVSQETLAAAGVDAEASGLKPGDQVKLYLHYGVDGDWTLQKSTDNVDTYRVAQKFFDATYETL
jgi:hypothetical protein